jgi:hypothetical protein
MGLNLPACLDWVKGVFVGYKWIEFVQDDLLPEDVKNLLGNLEFIYDNEVNLKEYNPYKCFVPFNQRPWDEVVKDDLLIFLLSNDVVRKAMLAYFNAKDDCQKHLDTLITSQMKAEEWNSRSNALQEKVYVADEALGQAVTYALQTPLIQKVLATVKNIVVDAESAREASLTLYGDDLTATMDRHRTTRDTLLEKLQRQLEAIEAKIIAENPEAPLVAFL